MFSANCVLQLSNEFKNSLSTVAVPLLLALLQFYQVDREHDNLRLGDTFLRPTSFDYSEVSSHEILLLTKNSDKFSSPKIAVIERKDTLNALRQKREVRLFFE